MLGVGEREGEETSEVEVGLLFLGVEVGKGGAAGAAMGQL